MNTEEHPPELTLSDAGLDCNIIFTAPPAAKGNGRIKYHGKKEPQLKPNWGGYDESISHWHNE